MSHRSGNILDNPIEYLKGVGPVKAALLQKEIGAFTWGDLLHAFPHRHLDKSTIQLVKDIHEEGQMIQLSGTLISLETVKGGKSRKRMTGYLKDATGVIELVWFQGIQWLEKSLIPGARYTLYGRVNRFKGKFSISHPEMRRQDEEPAVQVFPFEPVYPSTEKLQSQGLDSRYRSKLVQTILTQLREQDLPENLPDYIREKMKFPGRLDSIRQIHFPQNREELKLASNRLKFEELLFLQLRLLQLRLRHRKEVKGFVFEKVGDYFHQFYRENLPFELTGAQKRVMKEIRADLGSGSQMNRLLQGDVGSGKTIVALLAMLIALDNGFQACMMAPTEILAQQHYQSLMALLTNTRIKVAFLSGNVKGNQRKEILKYLKSGDIQILVGTHALIEESVEFKNLGLAITDEQHRFGVKQRAALWKKNAIFPPHILVMTATPIPRTLAMTLYGDLDVSRIDELPPGRKPVKTELYTQHQRRRVIGFMEEQIAKGRQVYVVYPLIEESEKLDLQNLQDGYDYLRSEFPPPQYQISVVHGKMKQEDKDFEMKRFLNRQTQIMVATTVIEVGVNVPNASVMVIENAEKFGLSQLHQLRGRVGRGADQSYCLLMTDFAQSADAKARLRIMCETNDGFLIAEEDLRLRGPGDLEGLEQSGITQLHLADLVHDERILSTAREIALRILENDPDLSKPVHAALARHLAQLRERKEFSRIS